jgi:hypothetical protein
MTRSHPIDRDAPRMPELAKEAQFEIRVRGLLGASLRGAFPGLTAREDHGETVLTGWLPDQAALHGVLAQIESLNLELIEVRRL